MPKGPDYDPLLSDPPDEFHSSPLPAPRSWASRFSPRFLSGLVVAETLTIVVLLALLVRASNLNRTACSVSLGAQRSLYSPALPAVENEVKVYNTGFGSDLSPFQIPSSPKLDQMWEDLYNFGISRITKDEAAKLPNKTHAIPGDDGHYIAQLDVFHSLHCLNKIRMALDPDYYPDWDLKGFVPSGNNDTDNPIIHISHCVDWVRQAIMCAGDTSVIVWQWHENLGNTNPMANIAHTCRNFEHLQDWGKAHVLRNKYNPYVHIEDDIVAPIFSNQIP